MSFHEENIPKFMENFNLIKEKIRNSPGNRYLELYHQLAVLLCPSVLYSLYILVHRLSFITINRFDHGDKNIYTIILIICKICWFCVSRMLSNSL